MMVQIYRNIILPLLRPITLSAMIILGHISLKVFDLIVAVAGKQLPLDVPAIYMWQVTFDGYFFGTGCCHRNITALECGSADHSLSDLTP